jgi:hypothetical protein
MKKIASLMLVATLLVAGIAFAADPVVGTWKLNVAKSKFASDQQYTAATRVYSEAGGVYTLKQKLTSADGKETSYSVQYSDGKDMKQQDLNSPAETLHAKMVSANTWDFELKRGGKVVGHVHRVVSADGKTLTVHNTGTQASGVIGDETLVYDKQ